MSVAEARPMSPEARETVRMQEVLRLQRQAHLKNGPPTAEKRIEWLEKAIALLVDNQRLPMPPVNWLGTVLHGLPASLLPGTVDPQGGYLAFLGRISPEKRPDRAIEIAAQTGIPLKIAAKIDNADRDYWNETIAPLVAKHGDVVEFVGEINDQQKAQFLGNAKALLFPIDWPEPFGLVMIEAMACATPVIAFRCGSVPEVIDHGVTGYVCEDVQGAVAALQRIDELSRSEIRAQFERRFSSTTMARNYVDGYTTLLEAARRPVLRRVAAG